MLTRGRDMPSCDSHHFQWHVAMPVVSGHALFGLTVLVGMCTYVTKELLFSSVAEIYVRLRRDAVPRPDVDAWWSAAGAQFAAFAR